MTDKVFFNVFQNNGDRKNETTFRVFVEGGGHEDVVADYRISGVGDNPPGGSGKKDKSKAGNAVIRLNVKVGEIYWRGTLNIHAAGMAALMAGEAQPEGERSGLYGTFTNKDKQEKEVAGWVRTTKNGQTFISCSMSEPYNKAASASDTATTGGFDDYGDVPF